MCVCVEGSISEDTPFLTKKSHKRGLVVGKCK